MQSHITIQNKMKRVLSIAILLGLGALTGCNGNGGGGGGIGNSLGGSLGGLIGGRNAEYVDAGMKFGSAITMSEKDEDELGQAVAIAATNKWPLLDNPALTRYVTLVGLTLADGTSHPDGNWVFGVLNTPEIGAYSGPNGYIMITRGALAAMENEAELAGVLAHEMSHVINRDGFKAVQGAKFKEAGLQAGSAAARQGALIKQIGDTMADAALNVGWSQSQETAADQGAVKLLIAAGYDPNAMPSYLKRVQAKGVGRGKLFGTHPGIGDRINRTTSEAGGKTGATNRERFVKIIADAKL